jgi:anaerobic selenocysteine-containing dehydrogenase
MKIDRRSFLSLGIGAAAGTALSPLPWKLTDDFSIWSQMWPWTPVPPDGESSVVNTVCTLCPGGCGIAVRKVENRAVKIEGLAGYPVNDGGICTLGLAGLQLLYSPTRVTQPLKRSGPRGAGAWQPISWDEALAELAKVLGDLRGKGQAHTLAWLSGHDRGVLPALASRFLAAYGSPNFLRMPSARDSYEAALALMQGTGELAGFDMEHADCVLSFGSGLIDGWGAPVRMLRAHSAWKAAGVPVIQVEPRLSKTAAKADRWVAVAPGSEAALALGIAHVLIQQSRYHAEFIGHHTFGFESWTDTKGSLHKGFKQLVIEEYSPEKVSAVTGLDKSVVIDIAQRFAAAKRPLALCGRGQGHGQGSLGEAMAVHALNALVGNINRPGGVWAMPRQEYISWDEVAQDAVAAQGVQHARVDGAGSERYPVARHLAGRLQAAAAGGAIKLLVVSEANPLFSLPAAAALREAFAKIPFVVSCSSFMDETAAAADLILPNHLYLERYEDVPTPSGMTTPLIGLAKPVVKPLHNTRHTGDVIIQLAQALGDGPAKALPWENFTVCMQETLGDRWDSLVEETYLLEKDFKPAPWYGAFETPSGKFEFVPTTPAASGAKTPPQPGYAAVPIEGEAASYPLLLIAYDGMRLSPGYVGTPPFLLKSAEASILTGGDSVVEIHPKTAADQAVREGQRVAIETPRGRAVVRVHLFEGIVPGVVAMPRGLGHSAYDRYLAGKGSNVNELIGPVEDPASGFDAAWGIRARLSKV